MIIEMKDPTHAKASEVSEKASALWLHLKLSYIIEKIMCIILIQQLALF